MIRQTRRAVLGAAAGLSFATGTLRAEERPRDVRIGYQKSGAIVVAKQGGAIERRLKPLGIETVRWLEFPSGPPLLEALGTGAVDFGTTGDTPPIFAQAAGADLLYVAALAQTDSAVLVPEGSRLQTVAELKGRKIAFTKGSSAHNFTVQALKAAGLGLIDVTPVHLSPADAAAAFARGSLDAWTIWDPFFALAERNQRARAIARIDGTVASSSFYLANGRYAKAHPAVLTAVLEELSRVGEWAEANRDSLARILAEVTGVDLETQTVAVGRARYAIRRLTPAIVADQQAVADEFHRLGLIPRPVVVRDIAWTAPDAT